MRSARGSFQRCTAVAAAGMLAACGHTDLPEDGSVEQLAAVTMLHSAPEVEFSGIMDIAVDSRGLIYAGDRMAEIMVLDSTGTLVRRFGRMGGGPGEFESINAVNFLPGDSLYVYDGLTLRGTVYAPNSERVAYTVQFAQPDFLFPMDVEPLPDGRVIAHFRRVNGDVPIAGQKRDDVIQLLDRDGSIRPDTVLAVREPDIVEVRTERMTGYFLTRFGRQTLVRWTPHGRIYSLWTDSARVHVHDLEGRPVGSFVATLPATRLPLSDATLDSLVRADGGGGLPSQTLFDAFRSHWKTWPLVQDMLVDDRERVWISPVTHASRTAWLGFDGRGRQVAAFEMPASVRPRLIRGDRVYAVSKDSLDVESIVVYRLAPASSPSLERS